MISWRLTSRRKDTLQRDDESQAEERRHVVVGLAAAGGLQCPGVHRWAGAGGGGDLGPVFEQAIARDLAIGRHGGSLPEQGGAGVGGAEGRETGGRRRRDRAGGPTRS